MCNTVDALNALFASKTHAGIKRHTLTHAHASVHNTGCFLLMSKISRWSAHYSDFPKHFVLSLLCMSCFQSCAQSLYPTVNTIDVIFLAASE